MSTSDTPCPVAIDAPPSRCSNTIWLAIRVQSRVLLEERAVARILVADDNSNIQKMVGLALKDQGIDVVAVGNGEAAVRKISELKPDLVLADIFMPVRSGYEVCSYVKEDPSLAHIPVILLVGAFDPLDEQEAQRVGADGVLKKPFVPPDPLISMVKSALMRAGIAIGKAAAPVEKAPEPAPAARPTLDSLRPAIVPKAPEPIAPQPVGPALSDESFVDEIPSVPPPVRIDPNQQPVAFGNLLETSSTEKLLTDEDDPNIISKPMPELVERNWGVEPEDETEEIQEEDSPHSGWRPGGLDAIENIPESPAAAAPDWREQAFHGNSPANGASSKRWTPVVDAARSPEPAEPRKLSVLDKPAETVAPFSGDAWAAAMASGLDQKLADANETQMDVVAPQSPASPGNEIASQATEPPSWLSSTSTQWESEAKKTSELAATWAVTSPEPKAPEAPLYSQAETQTAEKTKVVESAPADASIDSSSLRDAALAAAASTEFSGISNSPQQTGGSLQHEVSHLQAIPDSSPSSNSPSHEIPEGQTAEPANANWGSAWAAKPSNPVDSPETHPEAASVSQASEAASLQETFVSGVEEISADDPIPVAQASSFYAYVPEVVAEATQKSGAQSQPPDMDELVARVLAKMNPEVLQRVTREILRPVIEAIVQDEINSKKS
jgi:CheY-like chemotaxis protein